MAFSFAVAALIEGRVDAAWGRWVRPWTLAAWVFLTIGIALGSWWAYYELGWGGFWFWDPVENASFMPWLIAAALLHSRHRRGKARGAEELDDPAGDPRLRLLADRYVHRALGCADLGPCLRQRPRARGLHPADPGRLHGRGADALCRRGPARWRRRGSSPRSAAKARWWPTTCSCRCRPSSSSSGTLWPLVCRTGALPASCRSAALLQHGLHPLRGGAGGAPAHRLDAAVETGRPGASGAAAGAGVWCCRWRSARWPGRCRPGVRPLGRSACCWRPGSCSARWPTCGSGGAGRSWREAWPPDAVAARRLGQGHGACRLRRHDLRRRRRDRLEDRGYPRRPDRRDLSALGAYTVLLKDVRDVPGPNYMLDHGRTGGDAGRGRGRDAVPRKASLSGRRHAHDRGRRSTTA